ncbi:MAG: hypothetical protein EA360_06480 [Balneolaceae bacterium]|nr:MAG: hypothetical protein EA360_06480 [Balneolaceae bacterium]
MISCSRESESHVGELTFLASYALSVEDPSGLTMDMSGQFLWTVSDMQGGSVYSISFRGEILGALSYRGDDMEGITMNPTDGTLWVLEERLRQAVQLDITGQVLQRVQIPVNAPNENDGPEGIAINPENGHLYILNEKLPREFIELDRNQRVVRRAAVQFGRPFHLDDLSGLFYDQVNQEFWMVSDESAKIVVTNMNLEPQTVYNLDRTKFEGIAVDPERRRIYLVNDEEDRLYIYEY